MKNQSGVVQWPNKIIRCHDCGLKKLCFPKNLSEQEIAALEGIIASSHSYQRGDYLCRTGDYLSNLIIIKSGSVKTELISETGAGQIVGFHFPGDLLGLDSLSNRQNLLSVVFLENSNICTIPYQAFNTLSDQIPQLHKETITRLSDEIAFSHELMLSINNYSAEQRVAIFLQDLASRQHNRGLPKEHLHLSMSRNDIANYLGLASATVSRIISKFEREGFLQVDNKHLQLTNYQALINTAHACASCSAGVC